MTTWWDCCNGPIVLKIQKLFGMRTLADGVLNRGCRLDLTHSGYAGGQTVSKLDEEARYLRQSSVHVNAKPDCGFRCKVIKYGRWKEKAKLQTALINTMGDLNLGSAFGREAKRENNRGNSEAFILLKLYCSVTPGSLYPCVSDTQLPVKPLNIYNAKHRLLHVSAADLVLSWN